MGINYNAAEIPGTIWMNNAINGLVDAFAQLLGKKQKCKILQFYISPDIFVKIFRFGYFTKGWASNNFILDIVFDRSNLFFFGNDSAC